LKYYSKTTFS